MSDLRDSDKTLRPGSADGDKTLRPALKAEKTLRPGEEEKTLRPEDDSKKTLRPGVANIDKTLHPGGMRIRRCVRFRQMMRPYVPNSKRRLRLSLASMIRNILLKD